MKRVLVLAALLLALAALTSCRKTKTCVCSGQVDGYGTYSINYNEEGVVCDELNLSYGGVKLTCVPK